jgi:hypothetical protein
MLKSLVVAVLISLIGYSEASAAQLTISWTDHSGGLAGFRVERRLASATAFAIVASIPPRVTSYVDLSVASGSTYCYRVRAYDASSVSPYSDESCAAPFGTKLTVTKAGTGAGTVVSTPSGITCGSVCSATYAAGTPITLTATPATGSTFAGWSGGGCAGTAPCILATNVSTTVAASFAKLPAASSSPAALSLTYRGKLRDRVGQGNTARSADGGLDGTFTVRLSASGGRTITSLKLLSTGSGSWDTNAGTADGLLGVANSDDGALLNSATTMAVNFTVPDGGAFAVFAADQAGIQFLPGRSLTVTARFSDGSTASDTTIVAGLIVGYNGKLRDRVGQGNTARSADGALDGTLTARLWAVGGRTITSLKLESSTAGRWDTGSGTGDWLLGVASSLDGALLNNAVTMVVNLTVPDGGSFVVFASDSANHHFVSGTTLTLTARYSDGTTANAVAHVP